MNAQHFMNRAYKLKKKIASAKLSLKAIKADAVSLKGINYDRDPVSMTHMSSPTEDAVMRIIYREEALHDMENELTCLKLEIADMIDLLPDQDWQTVMTERHLCFKEYEDIAKDMTYSIRWVKQLHSDAMAFVEKKLEECDGRDRQDEYHEDEEYERDEKKKCSIGINKKEADK